MVIPETVANTVCLFLRERYYALGIRGGSDRMRVDLRLVCVINAFGHAIANAAGCDVMDKYPTAPFPRLTCTDTEKSFR